MALEIIEFNKTYHIKITLNMMLAIAGMLATSVAITTAVVCHHVITTASAEVARLGAEVSLAKREMYHTQLEIVRTCGGMIDGQKL